MTDPEPDSARSSRSSPPVDELADLVTAAQEGDRGAFDEIVRRTYQDTYTLAYRLTRNAEDARDVVQDAYMRAYRSIDRFRGEARFSTWMYRITANCAATLLNKRSRTRTDELPDGLVDTDPHSSPEARSDAIELRGELTAAIDALSPKLRSVVVLRDVYDLSHEEIATELGISVTAAKVRLHRARQQIKDQVFGSQAVRRAV